MSLHQELEKVHSTIKHFGLNNVDVYSLQSLIRQCQTLAIVFESHEIVSFQHKENGWEFTLKANVDSDTKASLMYLLEGL